MTLLTTAAVTLAAACLLIEAGSTIHGLIDDSRRSREDAAWRAAFLARRAARENG